MYNIRDGHGFGPPQGIWAVHIRNYDLMILMDKNILDAAYCHNHLEYDVVCYQEVGTKSRGAQGGVCRIVR